MTLLVRSTKATFLEGEGGRKREVSKEEDEQRRVEGQKENVPLQPGRQRLGQHEVLRFGRRREQQREEKGCGACVEEGRGSQREAQD